MGNPRDTNAHQEKDADNRETAVSKPNRDDAGMDENSRSDSLETEEKQEDLPSTVEAKEEKQSFGDSVDQAYNQVGDDDDDVSVVLIQKGDAGMHTF